MKTIKATSLLMLIIHLAVPNLFAQGFTLKGNTQGIPDSTWIYLRLTHPEIWLDSAQVFGHQFELRGKLEGEKVADVFLHTKGYKDYVSFWLENKPFELSLEAGKFKEASIMGSAIQDENQQLSLLIYTWRGKQDSVRALLKKEADTLKKSLLKEEMAHFESKEAETYQQHIKQHPNSWVSISILNIYKSTWGKASTQALFTNMRPEMQSTSYGQTIKDYLLLYKEHKIGDRYTDFEQPNPEGKMIKLSDIKGKYILLDFWASWCGPCRQENPNLVATYNQYRPKGFEILGVSLDETETHWKKAILDDKLNWENVSELNGDKNKASLIYGLNAIPRNFLIDEKGIIIAKDLRGEALNKKLAELLGN